MSHPSLRFCSCSSTSVDGETEYTHRVTWRKCTTTRFG